ncbi:cutinase-domain-containing protein [Panaeolus papilionaceus]|nr:cutinase-domain-containing protein [Panaeolus papilionaceus]
MFSVAKAVALATIATSAFAAQMSNSELYVNVHQLFCPDVAVFFARGTGEVGTIGAVVGPPVSAALKLAIRGNVDFGGVVYPAIIAGYLAGGDIGASRWPRMLHPGPADAPTLKSSCLGAGAQVTHRAANRLSASAQERVVAVVTFGDPIRDTTLPGVLQSRRKTFCAVSDLICRGQPTILPHLGYGDACLFFLSNDGFVLIVFVAARV